MYPVRGEGCKPSALLFRREDPPVTFETIARAYSLRPIIFPNLLVGDFGTDRAIRKVSFGGGADMTDGEAVGISVSAMA